MSNRWQRSEVPRGEEYDARWTALAAAGEEIHGEADLVEALLGSTGRYSVLDAGCGTGRVAVELARRGFRVAGVDADDQMLAAARAKAPRLRWVTADLAQPARRGDGLPRRVDLVLLAGNVMIFLEPGTEGRVLGNLAARLDPGGLVVAGFSIIPDRLSVERYDELAASVGLTPVARWSTWEREPFAGGDYAVSVHRAAR